MGNDPQLETDFIMTGVYYLWDGSDVIYIGSSTNVPSRVSAHRNKGNLDFAGYFCDECEEHELRDREAAAIKEFRPRLNEQQTSFI